MKLSIIIPVFNEEGVIPLLKERLERMLKDEKAYSYEVIFVDDGSKDKTMTLLMKWAEINSSVSILSLSRNFGHQQAVTAGLKEASGDAVVIMDSDLQDPPELIPRMLREWEKGYKVVLAERNSRDEGYLRKLLFNAFYKIFDFLCDMPISINSGVFGLMDKTVVKNILLFNEHCRFIPGLRAWVGFNTTKIFYDRAKRAQGYPRQSLLRLINYGLDAIFSFSSKPLKISLFLGLFVSAICFLYAVVLIFLRLFNINVVSGFSTTAVSLLFIGGVLLVSNGIIGEYLARIFDEVKQRPLYIVATKISRKPNEKSLSIEERY
ncbi:MAG: glycosyltransferase family 2 protein [Candidatus Omnitrophica bacterium]|nr:glycosyltransferase family 2 protein [Candidatus Omnitrophota bacterium]